MATDNPVVSGPRVSSDVGGPEARDGNDFGSGFFYGPGSLTFRGCGCGNRKPTTFRLYDTFPSAFEEHVLNVYTDARYLLLQKHKDYGPLNIARAPGGALNGLRVRIWDKLARINNLVDNDVEPENESLRDSFVDLLNYAAIAILVLDNNWPGVE